MDQLINLINLINHVIIFKKQEADSGAIIAASAFAIDRDSTSCK